MGGHKTSQYLYPIFTVYFERVNFFTYVQLKDTKNEAVFYLTTVENDVLIKKH